MQALRDTIEDLKTIGRSHALRDVQEKILIRIACHSVIRGCRSLARAEIESLLDSLDSVGSAGNCPHGRPILRRISRTDIEKMFKRV
jgi:DNA mismatch repair protein MutL